MTPWASFLGADCNQAPVDLDNAAIQKQTLRWINYFQTQDASLHSSAIDAAENIEIRFRGPHTMIDKDVRTWKSIHDAVTRAIRP